MTTQQEAPVTADETPGHMVRRILAGERSAEEELVRRYHRGLATIVGRIARDPSVTEDICQETFQLVLEKVRGGDLREPEKLSGFICSVARNLAIDHFRQAATRETLEDVEATKPLSDPSPDQLRCSCERKRRGPSGRC